MNTLSVLDLIMVVALIAAFVGLIFSDYGARARDRVLMEHVRHNDAILRTLALNWGCPPDEMKSHLTAAIERHATKYGKRKGDI